MVFARVTITAAAPEPDTLGRIIEAEFGWEPGAMPQCRGWVIGRTLNNRVEAVFDVEADSADTVRNSVERIRLTLEDALCEVSGDPLVEFLPGAPRRLAPAVLTRPGDTRRAIVP